MSLSELDLVVAGTPEGVLMVESEASELTEEVMLGTVTFGHRAYQQVIEAIIELDERLARDPSSLGEEPAAHPIVRSTLHEARGADQLIQAYQIAPKPPP